MDCARATHSSQLAAQMITIPSSSAPEPARGGPRGTCVITASGPIPRASAQPDRAMWSLDLHGGSGLPGGCWKLQSKTGDQWV